MVQSKRATRVEAVVEDAYDGVIRLLNDAQRFGYGLLGMAVTEVEGLTCVSLTLASPPQADARLLASRLGRHPAVVQVEARDVFSPETVHAFPEAQAA